MKPIFFNIEDVRAILDGRKTVTRKAIKPQPAFLSSLLIPPYRKDDILYVRETWKNATWCFGGGGVGIVDGYLYRAGKNPFDPIEALIEKKWHSPVSMPREAARLFLRVKDVRVQRLQDITNEQARDEGVTDPYDYQSRSWYDKRSNLNNCFYRAAFAGYWDRTFKRKDLAAYGWEANPYVWVIEFEKITKEETKNEHAKAD